MNHFMGFNIQYKLDSEQPAASNSSIQPVHPSSLIRAFAVHARFLWTLDFPQMQHLWTLTYRKDVPADLYLELSKKPEVGFSQEAAMI